MRLLITTLLLIGYLANAQSVDLENVRIKGEYKLPNNIAGLDYGDNQELRTDASRYIPVKDKSFIEHVRVEVEASEEERINKIFKGNTESLRNSEYSKLVNGQVTAIQELQEKVWIGTTSGLYKFDLATKKLTKHESYGVNGPLASVISDLAVDSNNNLWIGTPLGLTILAQDGTWNSIQGDEGLPIEEVTSLAMNGRDEVWIGTTQGAILYKPNAEGRQWYYRAGKRYLINNVVSDIEIASGDIEIYFNTEDGVSKIALINRTLSERAEIIEDRLNSWHRRMGFVAHNVLDDLENPISYKIPDSDNDGLWTAYHIMAMSLAYGDTGDEKYSKSAKEGMDALIRLQNISGIPGVIARSILPISERDKKTAQWRNTSDGKWIWKSDTSSDEIDGHFFAFYGYWKHIAQHDKKEAQLIKKQISTLMNNIVDNNYQLIDYDGERTKWGFWNPEAINDDPENYVESGLNSAQILSFLKTSYFITGNEKFKKHYDYLITEHGYLGNVLLEKKTFPDKNNHSDNQLGFVALYPLLQLEHDPNAREALQRTVRRHYRVLDRDGSAFFYFAAATIDLDFVDIASGVQQLREIPTDRRQWQVLNSIRKDITWNPYLTRFGMRQLSHVLPVDERNFNRWNRNPYLPDETRGVNVEDDGASWLLGYWLGRYHGFIGEGE